MMPSRDLRGHILSMKSSALRRLTMNRDKQIEEIACDLCDCMPYIVCDEYLHTCENCKNKEMAEYLYTAGYRKSSDIAREIFEEIEKALEQAKEIADIRIRELAPTTYKVMREVGKLYHKHDSNAIAELKKKYTEDN
jgi:hypothetical protein